MVDDARVPVLCSRGPRRRPSLVVIGGGIGSASVLYRIVSELPEGLPASVVATLHVPAGFSHALSVRMDARSALPVRAAAKGSVLAPGTVWMGPDDAQVRVVRRGGLPLAGVQPCEPGCEPQVDVLFKSAAERLGARVIGVVLSGVGQDGVAGARALRLAGADVLVQDPWSAIAWSLPGAVVRGGAATDVVTPELLAAEIVRRLGGYNTDEWAAA